MLLIRYTGTAKYKDIIDFGEIRVFLTRICQKETGKESESEFYLFYFILNASERPLLSGPRSDPMGLSVPSAGSVMCAR